MNISLYHVDAFTDTLFSGNPAAVCPLDAWLPDATMQAIARENNLSETGFFIPDNADYAIRWFTPTSEIDLCGHGTLSAGYVLFQYLRPELKKVVFHSRSGPLTVLRENDEFITLDFPARTFEACAAPEELIAGLNITPLETYRNSAYIVILENEEQIRNLRPDFAILAKLDLNRVMVSAPGHTVDFVSRYFAPREVHHEDPVTGAAHCSLTPYWADRLNKTKLQARQLSPRGGMMTCELRGERVLLNGKVVPYLVGVVSLPE